LVIAPSIANQLQSMPLNASYSASPAFQKRRKKPSATHAWKRSCAVEEAHSFVADSAFHWQPVRSTKKMASAQRRSDTRGRPPPKRCVFLCSANKGSINAHNSSLIVNRRPVAGTGLVAGLVLGLAGCFTGKPTIKPG
jgi:hypothetical protein